MSQKSPSDKEYLEGLLSEKPWVEQADTKKSGVHRWTIERIVQVVTIIGATATVLALIFVVITTPSTRLFLGLDKLYSENLSDALSAKTQIFSDCSQPYTFMNKLSIPKFLTDTQALRAANNTQVVTLYKDWDVVGLPNVNGEVNSLIGYSQQEKVNLVVNGSLTMTVSLVSEAPEIVYIVPGPGCGAGGPGVPHMEFHPVKLHRSQTYSTMVNTLPGVELAQIAPGEYFELNILLDCIDPGIYTLSYKAAFVRDGHTETADFKVPVKILCPRSVR